MADYAPPMGPPPPKAPEVPAGWVARWNDQYKEWFYVNVYTKKSQWEKPTAPVFPASENGPDDPPPGYEPGSGPAPTDTKKNPYDDHRSTAPHHAGPSEDDDAKLAAKLQAEEDARARYASPGAGAGSYSGPGAQYGQQDQYPQDLPPRGDKAKGGILGKLFGKGKASAGGGAGYGAGYGGYSPQPQQQQGYYAPPMQYGGPAGQPPMAGYGPPQQGYGYGGYSPQPGYGPMQSQAPAKRPGMGGAMPMALAGGALGMGAGLLGGGFMAHEMHERDEAYEEGYQDAHADDFGGGDDFSGGDFGGGDF
ncbi:hypothetical protein CP533_0231 [Ophiocordyceps camponoti-saundersi (nom. inval.)]|nr:hypothetical protein CP533_0231 [Ophiocordyceps camponoti-saundersi (nom. inval.)]